MSREKDCCARASPSCPRPVAGRPPPIPPPPPTPLSILPSYFFSGGKIGGGQTDHCLTSGQFLVRASLRRAGVGRHHRAASRQAGRPAVPYFTSSSQSLQRSERRGRRPKYTWQTGRQTLGRALSQITARLSPAHGSAGTRRVLTLSPPLSHCGRPPGARTTAAESRVQSTDAGRHPSSEGPATEGRRARGGRKPRRRLPEFWLVLYLTVI